VEIRFYIDPETGEPHIYEHGVSQDEVHDVLRRRGDDFQGRKGSRVRFGQTLAGRWLKVVYTRHQDHVFVITAYDLRDKELKAFRRRQRRKHT
jgi:hypothetical protein